MTELSFWAVWLCLVGLFLTGVAAWWFGVASLFYLRSRDFVYSRGLNGPSGQNVVLTCPLGTNISVQSARLQCADIDGFQPKCDPYDNTGKPNPSTTQDIKSVVELECNGENSCAYTVPFANPSLCKGCSLFQMVGTYTCA